MTTDKDEGEEHITVEFSEHYFCFHGPEGLFYSLLMESGAFMKALEYKPVLEQLPRNERKGMK